MTGVALLAAIIVPGAQAIMDVQQSHRPLALDHEQGGHPGLDHGHQADSLGDGCLRADGAGLARHYFFHAPVQQIRRHMPAQIAIGDDALQRACLARHTHAAQALGCHLDDRLAHGRPRGHQWHMIAGMHQLVDAAQLLAEMAAGVKGVKIIGGKAAPFQQGDSERIAQRQHHAGGGGGGEPQRAGFLGPRQGQHHVARLGQRAVGAAGDGNQRDAHALGIGDDVAKLRRAAGIGEGNQPILRRDHAEIAMACLGGMNEQGGGSGRGERGGDLAGDMAALAHAGDNDPALDRHQQIERPANPARIETGRKRRQAFGLQPQNALCHCKIGGGILDRTDRRHGRWSPSPRLITVHFRGRSALMGKNVGLGPAAQIEGATRGQEGKARLGQGLAALAEQHLIQLGPQRMQMQHVGSRIALLFLG